MSLFNWMIDLDQESNIANLKKENLHLKARTEMLEKWVKYLYEEIKLLKEKDNAQT